MAFFEPVCHVLGISLWVILLSFLNNDCSPNYSSTADKFTSSKKAGNVSQVVFFPSDKFLHHLKRKSIEPAQLKSVVFLEVCDVRLYSQTAEHRTDRRAHDE